MRRIIFIVLGTLLCCMVIYADHLEKGRSLAREGKFEQAREYFETILAENEDDAEAWYWLGRTHLMLNDHDEALDCFDEAIDLDETRAEYYFQRGNALGIKTQNSMALKQAWLAPKILNAFEKTIELDSAHIGGRVGAANFYLRAPSIMGGDIDKAKEQARALMSLDEFQGRMIMIAIYQEEEKFDLVEQEYSRVDTARIDSSGNYGFYNNFGYFLLGQKKYDKAIQMFKKQVQLAPNKVNPYDSLGDGYRAAGKYDLAIIQYRKALDIDPDFESSRKNLEELEKSKQ